MNTSPITQWDGVETYFTFAGSGFGTMVCLLASVAVVVAAIWYGTHHESRDFEKFHGKG
ncbi:hypothetical protein [Jiella avicenniae]|uniref:Uncharacterized protein n=1 Tax=Jiella avicenniae TaxID=2907202 RepID=A0A9X1P2F5_9HYPH|nr:hypothetical protein [Jiella avicenniae]MCE7028056.1 hypothetical protein [Jiella avicenniae]